MKWWLNANIASIRNMLPKKKFECYLQHEQRRENRCAGKPYDRYDAVDWECMATGVYSREYGDEETRTNIVRFEEHRSILLSRRENDSAPHESCVVAKNN